ncbi:MAG: ribosome maturation factor RimP [Caulobacteraceae bacterium]
MRGRTAEDFRLLELLDPAAEAAGYEIVRLRLMAGDHARKLQIMAEGEEGTLSVEDCARLSRALSWILDGADPIGGGYFLEVSSPGVDRPLTRPKDFANFAGLEVRLEIDRLVEGRKRFSGEIVGLDDGSVVLRIDGEGEEARLPFSWIVEAKLVLNEALMARGAAARTARLSRTPPQADPTRNP